VTCPPNYEQLDGSKYQSLNCGCCVTTDQILFEHRCTDPGFTRGPWPPTGPRIRTLTGDTSGGTNLAQNDAVATDYYDCNLDVRYRLPWADVLEWLAEGYFVSLSISYSAIKDPYRGSATFMGNHQIGMLGPIQNVTCWDFDPLYDGRRSGIPKGEQRVPLSMLKTAAGQLFFPSRTGGYRLAERYPGTAYAAKNPTPRGGLAPPPPSAITYGENAMIVMGGLSVSSLHRMRLKQGQPIYRTTSTAGRHIVTRMSRDADVHYTGVPADGWRTVIVSTRNFPDGVMRPIQGYVPKAAGLIFRVT
jgi:hypothetical protein